MPPLRDEDELANYKLLLALAERFADYIIWKQEPAEARHKHLSNYYSQREIERLMCEHRDAVCQAKPRVKSFPEPYHYLASELKRNEVENWYR
jgi:hypothetical protein